MWRGDTDMAGGATGVEAADVDRFLVSVTAALHKDGIVNETATN